MLNALPFLALPILIYGIAAAAFGVGTFDRVLFGFTLPSGAPFAFTTAIGLVFLGLVMLLLEVLKATNVKNSNSIIDHGLSTVLLIIAILMFVLWPPAGTSTFFILIMFSFIDVIAGFTVSIKTAQRDFQVDRSFS